MATPGTLTMTAETGTDGAVITSGTVGSMQYSGAAPQSGNLNYRLNQSGTSANYYSTSALASSTSTGQPAQRWRSYHKISAYPTGANGTLLDQVSVNGLGLDWRVQVTPSGNIVLLNGGSVVVFTSTYVVPLNTWFRIEVVSQIGATTSTGKLGLGVVTGRTPLTATNSSSQAYFYSAATNVSSNAGQGPTRVGKADTTTSWTCTHDWDDVQGDSTAGGVAITWTSAPSTWIGPGAFTATLSAVLAAAATAGMTVAGRKDISGGGLVAGAAGALAVAGSSFAVASSALSASAAGGLSIAPSLTLPPVLSMAAPNSLVVLAGLKTIAPALATSAAASLVVGPVRTQFGVVSMVAGSPAMAVGTLRTQFSVVPMSGLAVFSPIPNPGQSSPITLAGLAGLVVTGRQAASAGLALAGAGQMALAGSKALSPVLAVRGTPTLAVGVLLSRSILWAARGTPALTVGSLRTALAVWSVRGTAAFDILGRVIGDIHPHDNVIALLLEAGALAQILPHRKAAQLLDNGKGIADVLSNSTAALLLPGGMLAVIQD